MARLLSLPVVGGGALLTSPALWAAFVDGTMSPETALVRWGVGAVVCWLGFSLLTMLLENTSAAPRRTDAAPRALPAGEGPAAVRAVPVARPTDPS